MDSKVVNILGYDSLSKILYGLDHYMSYMYTQDGGRNWKFISKREWQRHQAEGEIALSTKVNDMLVGKNPSMNWTARTGHTWGGKRVSRYSWQMALLIFCCISLRLLMIDCVGK